MKFRLAIFAAAALGACGNPPSQLSMAPIFDGHNDLIANYVDKNGELRADKGEFASGLKGQSDAARLKKGGISGALVTVSSIDCGDGGPCYPSLVQAMDWFDALAAENNASIAKSLTSTAARAAIAESRLAFVMAVEGGDQFDGSLDNLRDAWSRGVRSGLIVYDHNNDLGDGARAFDYAPGAGPEHGGLSPLGRDFIAEMNRLGMIVDLSHAGEQTALDAIEASAAPVIFSHSGARARADTPRNLSDVVLKSAAARGALIMIPFVPYLTTTDHWRWFDAGEREYYRLGSMVGATEKSIADGMTVWDAANPQPKVGVADVADQIEYVSSIVGRGHVGIGTDFDGMGAFTISALDDASDAPLLIKELRRRGWSDADLIGLASENFLDFWARVEAMRDK